MTRRSTGGFTATVRRLVDHIGAANGQTVTEDVTETAGTGVAGQGATTFRLDGVTLCIVADPENEGRATLYCPAPPGVAHEMVAAEPTRFVHPPDEAGSERRSGWLGVRLDGTGDDAVDWDEISAILGEARTAAAGAGDALGEGPGSDSFVAAAADGAYRFDAELWLHAGEAAWYFITLPAHVAAAIDDDVAAPRRGFGSIRVTVGIGTSSWATSIFPDSKRGSYLLPVKKAVRTKQRIDAGDVVAVELRIV